ncbi:hypothetical protein CHH27_22350 [Labrenzia sp. VG12]|nr:hypothetical protein CHH27_22350 [Labrenzia sp. VG12]
MKRILFALSFSLICFPLSIAFAQSDCLKLAYSTENGRAVAQVADQLEQVLNGDGWCIRLVDMPNNRIAPLIASGHLDGVALRSKAYLAQNDQVVIVEEPVLIGTGYLVSQGREPLKDLLGAPNKRIGITAGREWMQNVLKTDGTFDVVETVPNVDRLIDMFDLGRIDGFLIEGANLSVLAPHLSNLATKVFEQEIHLYLARAHGEKAAPISDILKDYKANGGSFVASP